MAKKKIIVNKLMAKRKAKAQAQVSFSYFPTSMSLEDFANLTNDKNGLDALIGGAEEQLTLDDLLAQNAPEEFVSVYRERVAEHGQDSVWAVRKTSGDLSIRTVMKD